MDKYLLQILLETKTIIIPDLGALTITNEETGEVMFMSYLKYDDGALVKFISEKENISEEEAKSLITKYVAVIENKLDEGQEYEMAGFGKFYKKDGEIEFEDTRFSDETTSLEKPETTEAEVIAVVEPVIVPAPDKSLDEILEKPADKKKVAKKAKAEKKIDQTKEKENTYVPPVKETVVVEQIVETPEEVIIETRVETEPVMDGNSDDEIIVVRKKRKPVFWVLVALIVVLLTLAISTIFFYDQVKHYFPFMESQRTEVERNNPNAEEISEDLNESAEVYENSEQSDVDQMDQSAAEEPVQEVKNEPLPTEQKSVVSDNNLNQSGNNYYVIGGAFEMKENADRYVAKLIADGNQSTVLGPYGDVYMVAIASFNSEAAAMDQLEKLRGVSTNAWIFHKR